MRAVYINIAALRIAPVGIMEFMIYKCVDTVLKTMNLKGTSDDVILFQMATFFSCLCPIVADWRR